MRVQSQDPSNTSSSNAEELFVDLMGFPLQFYVGDVPDRDTLTDVITVMNSIDQRIYGRLRHGRRNMEEL